MPGRQITPDAYKFGYQGSEKDDEITNVNGSHFTTFYREGDTWLARWWSIDPKGANTPWESPYMLMGNNPINTNDLLGDKWKYVKGEGVSSKEFRAAKRENRRLRRHSKTYRNMYNELRKEEEVYTIMIDKDFWVEKDGNEERKS